MNRYNKIWIRPAAVIVGLALSWAPGTALRAQQPNPDVHAARLSYVEGSVQITKGSQILANPALANTPLFQGTVITAKADGRAEVQFDDGTIARISPNSSLKIKSLRQENGAEIGEMTLQSGLGYFELQGNSATSQMTARFGDASVTATGFTVLRIDMDNPPGELAVFAGNAHLERTSGLSLDLHGGESVALNASDPSQYNFAETIEPNSWDAWNADRDQELSSQQSAKTAASEAMPNSSNPAWADLDANGNWYNVPGQGYVWSPDAAASGDWQPYGCGSWVWNPQYGYVWASCDSWGYLPYNSGSWDYYDGFGWGWAPGYGYPWWTTGAYFINVGRTPFRYAPPHRPHGVPVHPPQPGVRGGFVQSNPVIAVNRIPRSTTTNAVRNTSGPVTIAGNTVEPLRPISPRPAYGNSMLSESARPGVGYSVFPNNGYADRESSGYAARPGYASPWTGTGLNRTNTLQPSTLTPGSTYHPPAASYAGGVTRNYSGGRGTTPHVSSGGGGGGGAHFSGGGGGGGGGHVSSGGGGHH